MVQGVSMAFNKGEFVSVIGPNGAGKTTLIGAMSGALPLSAGRILFQGRDISTWRADKRARHGIGRSFQKTNLFPGLTVLENVVLAVQAQRQVRPWQMLSKTSQEVRAEAEDWLCQVELSNDAKTMASALAHGNKRKLELAMLLSLKPEILLLDEPTAGMSLAETDVILKLISELKDARQYTMVLVEHKLDLVMQLSDKVVVLHQGRLLTEGSPTDVMANQQVEAAYLGGHYAKDN